MGMIGQPRPDRLEGLQALRLQAGKNASSLRPSLSAKRVDSP
jgi:hypothetical protein